MKTSLLNLFYDYFYSFLHPFKVHAQIYKNRRDIQKIPQLRLAVWGDQSELLAGDESTLNIFEQVGMSWFLVMIKAIYSIVSINLGIIIYQDYLGENFSALDEVLSPISMHGQKILLLYVIGVAALYPIILWFYIKLWSVLIRFFGNLFECEGDIYKMTEQVVGHSLVGHLFLLIPIFGDVARHFSSIVFIFAGLRENMKMSVMQSIIVICSPLLLLLILMLMAMAYVIALFSVI